MPTDLDRKVAPACPRPCSACPWRRSNQGKRHPGSYYTKANLRRLWAGLRRGARMSCHPTDPRNPAPPGSPPVKGDLTRECCGALILQQREMDAFQRVVKSGAKDGLREYRRRRPRGLTREGLVAIAERALFGGTPLDPAKMGNPDLSNSDVYYEPLGEWRKPEDQP